MQWPENRSLKNLLSHAVLFLFVAAGVAEGSPLVNKSMYNFFNPAPADSLREINGLYENPYTVDAGHVQMELYVLQYAFDRETVGTDALARHTVSVGPIALKAGLLNNLDAEIIVSPYTHTWQQDAATGQIKSTSGFGDLLLRCKLNLHGNDGGKFAIALEPFLRLPTSSRGFGSGSLEGGLILPIAMELPRGWWMILSPEADCAHDSSGSGYHAEFANTIYFSHSISGPLSMYIDFLSAAGTEHRSRWLGIIDAGLTFFPTRNTQIDLGLSVGVTSNADDLNPYLGFSFRF